jgi:hypothetical protein
MSARDDRPPATRRNRGWFRRGHDPRRHELTYEERRRGYETTYERYSDIYGDAPWLLWRVIRAGNRRFRQAQEARRTEGHP